MKIIIGCGIIFILFCIFGIGAILLTQVNYDEISK